MTKYPVLDTLYHNKFLLEKEIVKLNNEKLNPTPEKDHKVIHAILDTKIECRKDEIKNMDCLIELFLKDLTIHKFN